MKKLILFLLLFLSFYPISIYSHEESPLLAPPSKNYFLQMRLSWAVKRGYFQEVKKLIKQGADPSYFFRGLAIEGTPLMLAAGNGHKEIVEFLLDEFRIYRTLNARDRANRTAIRRAERKGYGEIVVLLSEIVGIDLMVQDHWLTRCGSRTVDPTARLICLPKRNN